MKKMICGTRVCEVTVINNYSLESGISARLERDTVKYAVERYFSRSEKYRRKCTYESWQMRLAKGKQRKNHAFSYLIPAALMELPGRWVMVSGMIDAAGVKINQVEIITNKDRLGLL